MISWEALGVAAPDVAHNVRHWIYQLGGVGLIPLGLLDASVVPLPGSMDVLTIVLASRDPRLWPYYAGMATIGSVIGAFITFRLARKGGKETLKRKLSASRDARLWPYYAGMATIGSVIGAFITFRLARKGGKETLKRKLSASRAQQIVKIFSRWGFWSIAIAALLPPPVPMVPFVIAAGATQYSTQKFLLALTLGRAIRYTALALLGVRYGRSIIRVLAPHGHPYLYAGIAAAVVAGVIVVVVLAGRKKHATA
jgi:membrane protein YqaA with SNARE-associated domain